MSLTITAVPTGGRPPSVTLSVAASGIPANTELTLWRIHPDGTEHRVIVTDPPRLLPDTWVGIDYHCPFNAAVTYRAEAGSETATVPAVLLSSQTWLISPSEPTLSLPVTVKGIEDRSTSSRAARFAPRGGRAVFHGEGGRDGIVSAITVQVPDDQGIRALIDQDSVILINTPGQGWRIGWMWAQPGQVAYRNPGRANWPYELVTIPIEESADPDVDLTPLWTCELMDQMTATEGIDCTELLALYATCNDLAINRRS